MIGGSSSIGAGASLLPAPATAGHGSTEAPADHPVPPLKDINLLHMVDARIAVSSAVSNPRDFPEFLVDNHLETAWNSQTGDLVGGWIDVELPPDVSVHWLEMTSGYSRIKDNTDLFLANHRVSRVEVIHDGRSLGEFKLDISQRGLQRIPVTGAGGVYRILVKATVSGNRRDWRELAVSELRVIGDPGKAFRSPDHHLQVAVGGLEKPSAAEFNAAYMAIRDVDADRLAFPSPEALCADFVRRAKADAKEILSSAAGQGIEKLSAPFCRTTGERHALPLNPTYHGAITVLVSNGLWTGKQLVVQVPRGYLLFPVYWAMRDPTDPGCPSIFRTERIEPIRVENGYLIVTETGHRFIDVDAKGRPQFLTLHGATWCQEATGKLTCRAFDPGNGGSLDEFTVAGDGTLRIQGRGAW